MQISNWRSPAKVSAAAATAPGSAPVSASAARTASVASSTDERAR
jgi:hypothetical protein